MERTNIEKISELIDFETREVQQDSTPKRPRAMTTLKLQWLAERVRKTDKIKKAIAEGNYHPDSKLVAKSILGIEDFDYKKQS